jgi:3-methyladenine DNA glycosylase AlkD
MKILMSRRSRVLPPSVREAMAELKRLSSAKVRDGMARYGLPSAKALGVSVGEIQKYGKRLGRNQALAEALWKTDVYEARLLASFVGEAEKLTPALMNRWCRDFDNWGVVDTVCFKLFDQSPHAWKLIEPWVQMKGEFQRRAGFVLLACVAAHSENIPDETFVRYLPLIERGAVDERNFVKKGVSWALRMVGRQGPTIHAASVELSRRLAESDSPTARWIGRNALKELTSPAVSKKVAGRARPLGAP